MLKKIGFESYKCYGEKADTLAYHLFQSIL